MRSSDISDPIMTLITHPHFVVPSFKREIKNDSTSNEYRNEGNSAYKNKMYEVALKCYNTALAYAPNMSIAMKLAYSNRSAVLFTLQCYRACLKDINTCITMGCPDDILEKLYKRREQAENSLWTESTQIKYSGEIFFKIPKRHPDIPCASAEIDIIMNTNGPKIVAKTDIKVGTVLALEKVFAGFVDLIQNSDATWISCYHCCKLSFNLFPCEGCCKALFCSKQCKDNCMKEYHNIECQILELVNWPITQMVLKAAIKMRNMCKSWDEMIELSKKYVNNKQKINQIKDIYDSRNCTSLLTFNHAVHFMHGMFFNTTIIWSHYISIIDSSGCFFPVRIQDKRYAIRAFARILMHLTIFAHPMLLATNNCLKTKPQIITRWVTPRLGLFPFIGKLKRSCIPNTYSTVINNNTTALVATQTIRAGTELSVSPINHWLQHPLTKENRQEMMYNINGTVCSCVLCEAEPKDLEAIRNANPLSDEQKKKFKIKLTNELYHNSTDITKVAGVYTEIFELLDLLHDVPFSKEYAITHELFRNCITTQSLYSNFNEVES
ncbi:uncharacterized protein LOC131843984 [Achroia grisella]|uniref:uncharacterized protein LOC131843984 n=1 Tax=Achroia grisella TaxID=688607 RepID=UPI0027D2F329|nr:uncharacterized protein LOC131843984 [Achroia grisella]